MPRPPPPLCRAAAALRCAAAMDPPRRAFPPSSRRVGAPLQASAPPCVATPCAAAAGATDTGGGASGRRSAATGSRCRGNCRARGLPPPEDAASAAAMDPAAAPPRTRTASPRWGRAASRRGAAPGCAATDGRCGSHRRGARCRARSARSTASGSATAASPANNCLPLKSILIKFLSACLLGPSHFQLGGDPPPCSDSGMTLRVERTIKIPTIEKHNVPTTMALISEISMETGVKSITIYGGDRSLCLVIGSNLDAGIMLRYRREIGASQLELLEMSSNIESSSPARFEVSALQLIDEICAQRYSP